MVTAARRRLLAVLPVAAIVGCRAIAGLHDLEYVALSTTCATPVLPKDGNGKIRLLNAGTRGVAADFCVRATGTSAWGAPVLSSEGGPPTCASGLPYAEATVSFSVPAGSIDVKAIAPGGSCAATATSEKHGIAVGDTTKGEPVMTVVRMGGGSIAERIVALAEEATPDAAGSDRMRWINALSGGGPINVGFAGAPSLPATVTSLVLASPIPPGAAAAPGDTALGTVDPQGYLHAIEEVVPLGAVIDGSSTALYVFDAQATPDVRTVLAIGDPNDPLHRVRGLACDDDVAQSGGKAPAGADAGTPSLDAIAPQLFERCTLTDLPSIAVDTFNAALYGAAAPYEAERRQAIFQALGARQSDLMCVIETSRESDKAGIASAAKAQFPYAYYPSPATTLDSQPTDPTLGDGGLPPAPTAPPCSGVDVSLVNSVYDCVVQSCSTTSDLGGTLVDSTQCLGENCVLPFSKLYHHGQAANACFDCIIYYAQAFAPFSQGKDRCLNDARQPFSFEGATSNMLLSHYPLKNQQAFILPGTGYRHAVLYAQADLDGQPIDFYCAQLISPLVDSTLPYVGAYGQDTVTVLPDGGQITENGWEDEQGLQVRRAIAFIQATSAASGRPAIIAGDWHSSVRTVDSSANVVLGDLAPEVTLALDHGLGGAFERAEPPGYTPACEYCPAPQNVYNGATVPEDFTATFLRGFPAGSTTEDSLWGTANDVPIHGSTDQPPPTGGMGPLSVYYGRLVRVTRPPVP